MRASPLVGRLRHMKEALDRADKWQAKGKAVAIASVALSFWLD
jgi:hypothetical protein